MSCFWLHQNDTVVDISEVEEVEAVTYYKIQVTVGEVKWKVLRRYNEFFLLHNVLVVDHGVSKDILPPKKVIRNKCPIFIERRRKGLESYLRNVLNYLKRTMPQIFVQFLEFHICDIFFLLQTLAFQFYFEGDSILSSSKQYTFNPLQLHAISEIVKNPFPEVEQTDIRYDLCHVLDFCLQLSEMTIEGSVATLAYSNIIPNNLLFELSSFKLLQVLKIRGINMENLYLVGNLRQTVVKLYVQKTVATNVSQILQCDVLHKSVVENSKIWFAIKELDFSNNNLTEIDESIKLVPNVEKLRLNQNKISSISNLSSLSKLVYLSIADNLISTCDDLHIKLGNLLYLDLSQNNIVSLKGFAKLYSLQTLDLNSNQLSCIEEVAYVGDLPCLENLILTGNTVSTMIDYRVKVLENFWERAKEICLDNEKASEPELDKVAIFRALKIVKEGKTPVVNNILLK